MKLNNKIIGLISTPEINFKMSLLNGFNKINKSSKFDKYFVYFWLFGPFLYLIERTPADIWLSLITIAFLIKDLIKIGIGLINMVQVSASFLVNLYCIISLKSGSIFSLSHSFVWIRFPIYAAAIQTWLGKDRDNRIIMLCQF